MSDRAENDALIADLRVRLNLAENEARQAWKVAAERRSEARRYYVAWQVARMRARDATRPIPSADGSSR